MRRSAANTNLDGHPITTRCKSATVSLLVLSVHALHKASSTFLQLPLAQDACGRTCHVAFIRSHVPPASAKMSMLCSKDRWLPRAGGRRAKKPSNSSAQEPAIPDSPAVRKGSDPKAAAVHDVLFDFEPRLPLCDHAHIARPKTPKPFPNVNLLTSGCIPKAATHSPNNGYNHDNIGAKVADGS